MGNLCKLSPVLPVAVVKIIKAKQEQPVNKAACIFLGFFSFVYFERSMQNKFKTKPSQSIRRHNIIKPLNPETSQCMETNV